MDRMNVGNYDSESMHALLKELGLKRDMNMTYEKKEKLKELDKAFAAAANMPKTDL